MLIKSMPFGSERRRQIKEESGYHCQICNAWHPPDRSGRVDLDAHSLDRTHKDGGMAVCRNDRKTSCHQRIHDVSADGAIIRQISIEAAQLAGLQLAQQMLEEGVPEKRIRRILRNRPF